MGMLMNTVFIVAAVAMTLAAFSFVGAPLIAHRRRSDTGHAELPLLATVAVFLLAIGLYAAIGRPDLPPSPAPDGQSGMPVSPADRGGVRAKAGSIAELVPGLEARLAADPDDAGGWLLLAKSYEHLGRTEEARRAYAKAETLGAADPAFDAVLAGAKDATDEARVTGRVTLADAARASVGPDDVVFVVARAVNDSPMPLAVLRRPAAAIPFDFSLSDAQAIGAGGGISGHDQVIVVVKVSPSGDALDAAQDIGAGSGPVPTRDGAPLALRIDFHDTADEG